MAAQKTDRTLPSLPTSDNKDYWLGEINLTDIKKRKTKCTHEFALKDREAFCIHCGMGYYISVDDRVEDGHLYHKDKLII